MDWWVVLVGAVVGGSFLVPYFLFIERINKERESEQETIKKAGYKKIDVTVKDIIKDIKYKTEIQNEKFLTVKDDTFNYKKLKTENLNIHNDFIDQINKNAILKSIQTNIDIYDLIGNVFNVTPHNANKNYTENIFKIDSFLKDLENKLTTERAEAKKVNVIKKKGGR